MHEEVAAAYNRSLRYIKRWRSINIIQGDQLALDDRRYLGHGHRASQLDRQRGHPSVTDSARDDLVEGGQVAVTVECEPVQGDAAGHPDSDRGDLAVRAALVGPHPDAATSVDAGGS